MPPKAQKKTVKTATLNLSTFEFPPSLPNNRANFRLVVDVRYLNARGDFKTETAVLPGLESFLECDPGRRGTPEFVRLAKEDGSKSKSKKSAFHPAVDVDRVDPWSRLAFMGRVQRIEQVRVKVLDVDRKTFVDDLTDGLGRITEAVLTDSEDTITDIGVVGSVIGSAADDLRSVVMRRLAGDDRLLFQGSGQPKRGKITIEGNGLVKADKYGAYRVVFSLSEKPA